MRTLNTTRYRIEETEGTEATEPTVIYNHPSGTVRSTIPRNHSTLEYGGCDSYESNETYDVESSGYHAARRRGDVVANDYRNVKTSFRAPHFNAEITKYIWDTYGTLVGDYRSKYNQWPCMHSATGSYLMPTPDINIDYVIDKAVTALHARLSAAPMQALVTLGEYKQTIGLCRSLLSRTASMMRFAQKAARSREFRRMSRDRIIRTLEKGHRVKNANRAVNRMSRQWLEYRYGIKQMYYDYSAAAKAMRSLGAKPRQRYTAYSEQSETSDDTVAGPIWQGMSSHTCHRQASHHVIATAGALVEPVHSNVGFVQAFGLDEVFQAAWDLTRFSFVIDWFLNTGEKIAALSPKGDIVVRTSWVKMVSTITKQGYSSFVPEERVGNTLYEIKGWNPNVFERSVTTIRLINPVINPIPNWDIRLNVEKITDLLAILKTLPVLR